MRGRLYEGVSIAHGGCKSYRRHQRQIRRVIDDTGDGPGLDLQLLRQSEESCNFITASLDYVAHLQLAHPRSDCRGTTSADGGHLDAAVHEQFDAMAIANVKDLQGFTLRREIKAPVGEYAIDIKYQQLDRIEGRGFARLGFPR